MRRRGIIFCSLAFAVMFAACSPLEDNPVIPDDTEQTPGEDQGQTPDPEPEPEPVPEPEPFVVPVVEIDVENAGTIDSKDNYVNVTVSINEGTENVLIASGRVKGRGNATWNYPKKPYKIKFDQKQSVLGFPANKDWVLLADYCDKSLMRTAYMCELAQLVDAPYPIRYRHVQLYINGRYNGLYVLTDQVEKKGNRVDIEDDGYLFENDNYFYQEPLNFQTSKRGYWYTFKYPDPEDGEIAKNDENYTYIVNFMNEFEKVLYGKDFKDPENGYRKYIDVRSFAKWFLVEELTANLEPNMYYVLPSKGAKLQIGPVWDAEWSLGLAYRESETAGWASVPTKPDSEQAIWSKWKYFGRLFEDPYFVDVVREEWAKLLLELPAFKEKMAAVAEGISEDQVQNFERWSILNSYISVGLVYFGSWEAEVEYVAGFFDKRVNWLGNYLAKLP